MPAVLGGSGRPLPYDSAIPVDLVETSASVEKLDRRIITHRGDVRDVDDVEAFVESGGG